MVNFRPSNHHLLPSAVTLLFVFPGTNFGTDNTQVAVTVSEPLSSSVLCKNITILVPHTQISCALGPGNGTRSVSVSVSGQTASFPNLTYSCGDGVCDVAGG